MTQTNNADDLQQEMAWLSQVIDTRLKLFFAKDCAYQNIQELQPPTLKNSSYAQCIERYQFGFAERVTLALALVPALCPERLDVLFLKNQLFDRRFSEFGGHTGGECSGFMPTVQTLLFVLAGDSFEQRLSVHSLFEREHAFMRQHILYFKRLDNEPLIHSPLQLSEEYLTLLTTGQHYQPSFGSQFPAQLIETGLCFDDVVLHPGTLKQVLEIQTWITHGPTLMQDWGMSAQIASRPSQLVLRPARNRQNHDGQHLRQNHRTRCLQGGFIAGGVQIHRRNRKKSRQSVRPGRTSRLDIIF